ncbi:MAG: histidinol-phosphate transaminase [Bacteroidales bacterium]
MNLQELIRPNIQALKPYSSARSEYTGEGSVFLDANENPFSNGYNRYPDPLQRELKNQIARIKNISPDTIFLGNGSDEAIDLIFRIFCEPGKDNVIAPEPTYGMYEVCAQINNVDYRKICLCDDFQPDPIKMLQAADANTKIIFLCSPNNPTGNLLDEQLIREILDSFHGIVVLDEAYIDFASRTSMLSEISKYPHLIILQTFSKAWGQAAIRLGMAFAAPTIIEYFNKVKYPYNINVLTQQHALQLLTQQEIVSEQIEKINEERTRLIRELEKLEKIIRVYPTDANFVLIRVLDADAIYRDLTMQGVIVRNRNKITLCEGCLRITIGTQEENDLLLNQLRRM